MLPFPQRSNHSYVPDSLRPGIQPKLQALRALYEGKKIIVGRDKLDVVKGVMQKVRVDKNYMQDKC